MVLQRKRGRRRGRRAFCLLSDSYIQSGINSEAMRLQSAYAACCSAAFSWKYKLFFVGGLSISLPLCKIEEEREGEEEEGAVVMVRTL